MNKMETKLKNSIIGTQLSLLLFQLLFLSVTVIFSRPGAAFSITFYIFNMVFMLFITLALTGSPELFETIPDGRRLSKINSANILTLLRMSSMPNILALILIQKSHSGNSALTVLLICALAIVFITDFLDGTISRKCNQCTRLGSILDSMSDYLVLFVITIAFFARDIIGPVIFTIIMTRGLSVIVIGVVFRIIGNKSEFGSTYLGKVSVFTIMVLYGLELFQFLSFPQLPAALTEAIRVGISNALLPIEWISCAIILISIGDKAVYFKQALNSYYSKVQSD